MFTTVFNPIRHTVREGICQTCQQPLPGQGTVYTKQGQLLTFIPTRAEVCTKESSWQQPIL